MCDQCNTNCIFLGNPLKDFILARARRDGRDWKEGEWGLIYSNNPSYKWSTTPVVGGEPSIDFAKAFYGSVEDGFRLYYNCLEAGYNPEVDGHYVAYWLYAYLAKWIETAEVTEEPQTDSLQYKTNYAIKKQVLQHMEEN